MVLFFFFFTVSFQCAPVHCISLKIIPEYTVSQRLTLTLPHRVLKPSDAIDELSVLLQTRLLAQQRHKELTALSQRCVAQVWKKKRFLSFQDGNKKGWSALTRKTKLIQLVISHR